MGEEAARRLALDIGVNNQLGSVRMRAWSISSRGTGKAPDSTRRTGSAGWCTESHSGPAGKHLSNPVPAIPRPGPRSRKWRGSRYAAAAYKVYGGDGRASGVIVSQTDEPVEFAPLLNNRIANLVPVDDLGRSPVRAVTELHADHRHLSRFPELVPKIRDRLAFHGAQRLVTLGYVRDLAAPSQDRRTASSRCVGCASGS